MNYHKKFCYKLRKMFLSQTFKVFALNWKCFFYSLGQTSAPYIYELAKLPRIVGEHFGCDGGAGTPGGEQQQVLGLQKKNKFQSWAFGIFNLFSWWNKTFFTFLSNGWNDIWIGVGQLNRPGPEVVLYLYSLWPGSNFLTLAKEHCKPQNAHLLKISSSWRSFYHISAEDAKKWQINCKLTWNSFISKERAQWSLQRASGTI